MFLDYLTLLLARLGMDVVLSVAFLCLVLLRPALAGPRWWWKAFVLAAGSTLALLAESQGYAVASALLFGPLLILGVLLAWVGTREFLGMPLPLRRVAWAWLVVMGVNALLTLGWDSVDMRRAWLWSSVVVVALLLQRDLFRAARSTQHRELVISGWLAGVEGLVALVVLLAMPWWPEPAQALVYDQFKALLFMLMSLSVLLRGVIYAFLVTLELQKSSDEARDKLAQSESELRTLVDNINAGVIVLKPDQSVVSINASARAFLAWDEVFHPSDLGDFSSLGWRLLREDGSPMPQSEAPVEQVLATGQSVSDVLMGVQVNALAPVRWALCNAFGQTNAAGELRRVVFTLVDITARQNAQAEREQLEQQLAQSQKLEALGTLAGGVAHDFNNILAAILGNAELLKEDLGAEIEAHASLQEISVAARRGRELVRQVLAFSRQQPKQLTAVNLIDALTESCQLLRAAMPSRVELVPLVVCDTPTIMADSTQIGQVLVNLGSNALNAMGERTGRVVFLVERLAPGDRRIPESIRLASDAGVVSIAVSDQGCGMDPAVQKRIFEPFFTTQMGKQSTGLGLPVVLGIVQSHGGDIQVESEVGVGTTFTLYFPAVDHTALAQTATLHAPALADAVQPRPVTITTQVEAGVSLPLLFEEAEEVAVTESDETALLPAQTGSADALGTEEPGNTILYLDDDDALVFLVRRLLERKGFQVSVFNDQQEAIEAVRKRPKGFALFMTDYNMPGMSGLDVASAVLAINPALTVALASGYITEELQQQAAALGVREVVFKTDAVESFCDVVARLAQRP